MAKKQSALRPSDTAVNVLEQLSQWLHDHGMELFHEDGEELTLCGIESGEMEQLTPCDLATHVINDTCPLAN